jgi:hypothetical protein
MSGGLKSVVMKQAMKFMQSDTAMKLMQDQRVMNVVMKAFTLKSQVQGQISAASELVAHTLGFATREEVDRLKETIRDLESELAHARSQESDNAD